MAVPFLNSITLNKNEVQDFKVYNIGTGNPTLSSGGDIGYFWTDTTGSASARVLKWWDGSAVRTVLDTSSSISGSQISGNITGGSGFVANALTAGSYLTSGGTFDGSVARTFAVDATDANTASKIVARDASGNFSAGTITASLSGNATTATTADKVANALTAGTYLTAGGTFDGSTARTFAVDATSANTASKVVARDASGNFSAGVITATNVTGLSSSPSNDADAASKGYVDSVAQGLDVKASCKVATTANITLSSPGSGLIDNIDPATFTSGTTRILVKNQSLPEQNGIYIWNGTGSAMTRSLDANTWDELVGAFTFIEEGDTNSDSGWVCNANAGGTLGTSPVTWTKFSQAGSYNAGNGLVLSGGTFHFATANAYTPGQIPFASSSPAANSINFSSNLFWDNGNSRLGIGTPTPANKLEVQNSSDADILIKSTGANAALILDYADSYGFSVLRKAGNQTWSYGVIGDSSASAPFVFRYSSSNLMTLSSGGNLGLGAVPVAADGSAKTFQVGGRTVIQSTVGTQTLFANNAYYDGAWKRIVEGYSNAIRFNGLGSSGANAGAITFSIAASGSAGSTITNWDSSDIRMVLSASGNLGIGTTTPNHKLQISNDGSVAHAVRIYDTGANASYLAFNASNTDTGIIASGSSAIPISFYTAGSPRATIAANGNLLVGGTGDPNYGRTTISAYSSTGGIFRAAGTNTNALFCVAGTDDQAVIGTTTNHKVTFITNDTAKMTLDASGNLGVGATSPSSFSGTVKAVIGAGSGSPILTMYGGNSTYSAIFFADGVTGSELYRGTFTYDHSDDSLAIGTAGQERARLSASGAFLLKTNGTASAPTIANSDNPDTGLYWPTDNDTLALAVGGSDAIYIDSNRNVGFGTPTPAGFGSGITTLDIKGSSGSGVKLGNATDSSYLYTTSTATYFRTASLKSIIFGTFDTERLTLKSTGQLNFAGLASAPTGAVGDLYYNSTSNTLQYHNNSAFQQLSRKYSAAGAGTGTTITVTHNFGTKDVIVQVRDSSDAQVLTDVSYATNSVTVTFASSQTLSNYTVTVIG